MHSFNIRAAQRWGVSEAVMLHHLTHWVEVNAANQRNLYQGRAYTYNTYDAFAHLFPYWNKAQVGRMLRKLEGLELIHSEQLKLGEWKRVKYYTVQDEVRQIYGLPLRDEGQYESVPSRVRNRTVDDTKAYRLPNTDINTDKNNTVVLPWEDDCFVEIWTAWKADRKERRKTYTARGEQMALKQLQKLSKEHVGVAIQIVEQSMANGWTGLFELKQTNQAQRKPGPGIDIDRIRDWAAGG